MRYLEILSETFPYPAGTEMPAGIVDYRDPTKSSGKNRRYQKDKIYINGKKYGGETVRYWDKKPRTHVMLTKDGGLIVFNYADHNTIPWRDLSRILHSEKNPILGDTLDISVKGTGYLIDRSRDTGNWSGDKNKYSSDVKEIVQKLFDLKVANESTPIWLGNWAAGQGEHIGNVRSILKSNPLEKSITLYHGSDTFRLHQIMQNGLKPLEIDDRVWNARGKDHERPAHREEAVYLTASKPQAEYYAKKAVNTDRKRFGPEKRYQIEKLIDNAKKQIDFMTRNLERFSKMTPEQIESEDAHTLKYGHDRYDLIKYKIEGYPGQIARYEDIVKQASKFDVAGYYGNIEPVILQITIRKSEFNKFMADDDFLFKMKDASPEDWQESLSHFGQVAFKGTIPPNRIKVIAKGKDAGQISR